MNNTKSNINDFYDIKALLGQGGFGKVYKAIHKITNMVRAVKVIPKTKLMREGEEKLIEETNLMIQMDHPNIVKLFEMFTDDNAYYLVS